MPEQFWLMPEQILSLKVLVTKKSVTKTHFALALAKVALTLATPFEQ